MIVVLINFNRTSSAVYWPPTWPNMPFQKWQKLYIPLAWASLAVTIWDRVKIPRYSHKLMHRKRVTCELHDSYFRSMMIKTCHSKDGGSGYSFGHLWGEIVWALNYYITQCTGNSISLGIRRELEKWCCRENSTQQRAGPPGLWLSNPGERERHTAMSGGAGEVNMLPFCLVSNSLSHTTLSNKVRGIFF